MSKEIVIYVPDLQDAEVLAAIYKRYKRCRIVQFWEEGAIMWQDAIGKKYPAPGSIERAI